MNYENPLIVQGDRSLLLDVHAPLAEECRNALIPFAELEKSPEHLHTYKLSPLSLWNAASANFSADDAIAVLQKYARYDVPQSIIVWIKEISNRFGKIKLINAPNVHFSDDSEKTIIKKTVDGKEVLQKITEHYLYLVADSLAVFKEIGANHSVKKYLTVPITATAPDAPDYSYILRLTDRGTIKQLL